MLARIMKRILLLFACWTGCAALAAEDLPAKYASYGQLIITPFASAPFPHPARAEGHRYGTNFFSAAAHYSDNHVAIFIPKDFQPGRKIDFVVHFHGWGNNIARAFTNYDLAEQFADSHRNAILVVPQGPFSASDSFDGKLEDPDGFKRFMDEVMSTLQDRGVIKGGKIGQIILSGHSGGYQVISSILAVGGLTSLVREVWLFDADYGRTERFVTWFDHHKGRFINVYTEHGGTKGETQDLIAALKGSHVPLYEGNESTVTPKELRDNHLVFLFSELPHDQVMQTHHTFQHFLETSFLPKTH